MRIAGYIVLAGFSINLIHQCSFGSQVEATTSPGSEMYGGDGGRISVDLDDLVIEIEPPAGRKHLLGRRQPVIGRWSDEDTFDDLSAESTTTALERFSVSGNRGPRLRRWTTCETNSKFSGIFGK